MTEPVPESPPSRIDLAAFAVIVDLRPGAEAADAIPGSVRPDEDDIDAIERILGDRTSPVLLYCGIGEASRIAARQLIDRGFINVVSLQGGIRRWRAESRPLVYAPGDSSDRYDRHTRLDGIGTDGHRAIRAARILVVGAGGLGSPVIAYLAAAGVGTIGIVDGDRVDRSNLHRQVLFDESTVGMRKVDAVRIAVERINADVTVRTVDAWFDPAGARDMVAGYDLIVDASDNFPTRLAVNDAAAAAGLPFIHGAAIRWEGMVAGFEPRRGPCYRCLFPSLPDDETTCGDVGVLGPVTGVIGSLMAVEAVKHVVGSPDRLIDRLIIYDARSATFTSLKIAPSASCPIGHETEPV